MNLIKEIKEGRLLALLFPKSHSSFPKKNCSVLNIVIAHAWLSTDAGLVQWHVTESDEH